MKLETKTLEYYDWDDIQAFLCEELGITENQFRSYKDVVGGERYKDIWHIWIDLNHEDVENDSFKYFFIESEQELRDRLEDIRVEWAQNKADCESNTNGAEISKELEEESKWITNLHNAFFKLSIILRESYVHYCW